MNENRVRKYQRKIEIIKENMRDIALWSANLGLDELLSDKKTRYAIYKAYQEIVEAFMDTIAMIIKDLGLLPEDDYTNIEKLVKNGILDQKKAHVLEIANNARNWIVHRYNKLDDKHILMHLFDTLREFNSILKVIQTWIQRKFSIR